VHGHNYRCQVTVEGAKLDDIGLLVDFVELKRVVHACSTGWTISGSTS
jgi:6-pyruvoyl-tetrahydropterin synthase